MEFFKVFKDALTNQPQAVRGIFLKSKHVFFYVLLLAMLIAIPNTLLANQIITTFTDNFTTVAEKMPDFTVKDGQIEAANQESFIVNTDYIVYGYDPSGQLATDDLTAINQTGFIIENEEKQLKLTVQGQGYGIPYTDDFTATEQQQLFSEMAQLKIFTYPLTFLFIVIGQMFYLWVLNVLIGFASRFSKETTRLKLTFKQRFRLGLINTTIPVIIVTLLNLFQIYLPYQFEILLIVGAYRTMRAMQKIKVIHHH